MQTQLSKDKKEEVSIVPDTEQHAREALVPFTDYLPDNTVLVVKDLGYVHDAIERIYNEGFARQAQQELEAASEMEEAEQLARLKRSRCSPQVRLFCAVWHTCSASILAHSPLAKRKQ